jgi:hypothetical protein
MSVRDKNYTEIHIPSMWCPYYYSVRYYGIVTICLRFWKISSFSSKPKGVSLQFYQKSVSAMKAGRKSVFHPCVANILARLELTVLYTICLRFQKISSFGSKLKGVCLWFYGQTSVHIENGPKIHISSPWGSYYISIRLLMLYTNF